MILTPGWHVRAHVLVLLLFVMILLLVGLLMPKAAFAQDFTGQ